MPTYPGIIHDIPLTLATRSPQLKKGYLVDGTDKQVINKISTPRKEPLETAWKQAINAKI